MPAVVECRADKLRAPSFLCLGDWPALDIRARQCLRWLRQAGLALFFLVPGWAETPATPENSTSDIFGSGYLKPTIGIFEDESPTCPKSVYIGSLPPDKDFFNTIVDRTPLIWSDGDELRRGGKVGKWSNDGSLRRSFSLAKNWLVRVTDSDICPTFEVVTWCGPEIFQGDICHDRSVIINQFYAPLMNKYIRPQLRARGFRLISGDDNEPPRDKCQENCRDAGDRAPVIVKGFGDLNEQVRKEAIEGAIFVFGCLIIFAYFALEIWKTWKI